MSSLKLMMAMATMAAMLLARADEFVWPASSSDEGVIVLQGNDKSGRSSLTNCVPSYWAGEAVVDDQHHYWVPAGYTIYGTATGVTFGGKSLTVEGTLRTTDANPIIPRLRFLSGSFCDFQNSHEGIGGGNITISSTGESPVKFRLSRSGSFTPHPVFGSGISFSSDSDSWLVVQNNQSVPKHRCSFNGCDFSGFYGTLKMLRSYNNGDVSKDAFLTNMIQGTITMPGSYILGKGVMMNLAGASACLNAGNFTAEAGSWIFINSNVTKPVSTVTNRLVLGRSVDVYPGNFSAPGVNKYNTEDYVLFKLKEAAAQDENLPDVEAVNMLKNTGYNYYGLPQMAIQNDAEEAGAKILAFRSGRPLCSLKTNARYVGENGAISTFTNKTLWSTGDLPTSSENAYVNYDLHVARDFETYCFAASGMVIGSNGGVTPYCAVLTVTNLFLAGGYLQVADRAVGLSNYMRRGMGAITVKGDYMGVYGGTETESKVMTMSSRLLVIDYPIYGDGNLRLNVRNNTSYPYGGIELTHLNTNFTGKALVYSTGNSNTNSATGYRLQMYLNDARNLGGPMPTETFDGITMRGDPLLISTNSLCFNQENRHLYVYDRARIVMQHATDNTFEVRVPLTFRGELVFGNEYPNAERAKVGKGGGTLVLGGEARFYDSSTSSAGDTPVADKNKLTMLIGKLRPDAVDAVNGVAVTFGEESQGLEVDYANESLRTTGFKMTKSESALTKVGGGQIPVSFINMPDEEGNVLDVAVCTVPDVDAEATCNLLKPIRAAGLGVPSLKAVSNGDGTSTVKADFKRVGFRMVVR